MRRFALTLALLAALAGCAGGPAGTPWKPGGTSVSWEAPTGWVLFERSAGAILDGLCERYGVSKVHLTIDYGYPPVDRDPKGNITGWIHGLYSEEFLGRDRVFIWMRTPYADRTEAELRHTLLHEFLHHLDFETGAPEAPIDHNGLFDKRIREMGLDLFAEEIVRGMENR